MDDLAPVACGACHHCCRNEIRPPLPAEEPQSGLDSTEIRPTVIVAPELRGRRDFAVIREPDETDEDYRSRCELLALLLDNAGARLGWG